MVVKSFVILKRLADGNVEVSRLFVVTTLVNIYVLENDVYCLINLTKKIKR